MIAAVHQPNFLPWLGYFHKIVRSDKFVLLDDVQYVKGTVANRAYILRKDGKAVYLTVPVKLSKGFDQLYNEIEIDYAQKWPQKGLNLIKDSYQKSPNYGVIFPNFSVILRKKHYSLSELNVELIKYIADYLSIRTPLILSSAINSPLGTKSDRNLNICLHYGAEKYLSGSGAKKYNDDASFKKNNVELLYTSFHTDEAYQANDETGNPVNLSILHFMFMYPVDTVKELIYDSKAVY
jgi:WbqC-like protein family